MTTVERFMAKVNPRGTKGCWLWTASKFPNGYGLFTDTRGNPVGAHRWSYEAFRGPIASGMCVLHTCDTKDCVNPKHLKLGTQRENLREAVGRRRVPRGNDHYTRRQSERMSMARATDLRRMYRGRGRGLTQRQLAQLFDISQSMTSRILKGEAWL